MTDGRCRVFRQRGQRARYRRSDPLLLSVLPSLQEAGARLQGAGCEGTFTTITSSSWGAPLTCSHVLIVLAGGGAQPGGGEDERGGQRRSPGLRCAGVRTLAVQTSGKQDEALLSSCLQVSHHLPGSRWQEGRARQIRGEAAVAVLARLESSARAHVMSVPSGHARAEGLPEVPAAGAGTQFDDRRVKR